MSHDHCKPVLYNRGMLRKEKQVNGMVWVFRWSEEVNGRYRNRVKTRAPFALGVRGCPNSTLPKSAKYFEIMVSAAGLEPATHALKGHCSTN